MWINIWIYICMCIYIFFGSSSCIAAPVQVLVPVARCSNASRLLAFISLCHRFALPLSPVLSPSLLLSLCIAAPLCCCHLSCLLLLLLLSLCWLTVVPARFSVSNSFTSFSLSLFHTCVSLCVCVSEI